MREHLYKGKRIDNGEWVEGNLFIPDEGYNAPTQICIGTDRVRITYNVDPETVCEYAGLTDKNGKRIFEGRIVMAKVGLRTYMGIVKYDEKCAMFIVETFSRYKYKTEHTDKLCFSCEYITEVIGNKWDNPELLQEA